MVILIICTLLKKWINGVLILHRKKLYSIEVNSCVIVFGHISLRLTRSTCFALRGEFNFGLFDK